MGCAFLLLVHVGLAFGQNQSSDSLFAHPYIAEGASGQFHDVYVVFVNSKQDQGTLMLLMGAEFVIKYLEKNAGAIPHIRKAGSSLII